MGRLKIKFFLSAAVITLTACIFNTDSTVGRTAMLLSDAFLFSLLLGLMPAKAARCMEWAVLTWGLIVSIVESFLYLCFDYGYTPSVFLFITETTPREVEGFISAYVLKPCTLKLLTSYIIAVATIVTVYRRGHKAALPTVSRRWTKALTICIMAASIAVQAAGFKFRSSFAQIFISSNHDAEEQAFYGAYSPTQRIIYSINSLRLARREVERVYEASASVGDIRCNHTSPLIVFYIGESYARSHSALYGYPLPTTPFQSKAQEKGNLIPFTNARSTANYTSLSWKNMLSTASLEDGNWDRAPLLPAVMRKAGYRTGFITSQFLSMDNVFSFASSFFLNEPKVSRLLFDYRNTQPVTYDEQLLPPLDSCLQTAGGWPQFIIFNGNGQHFEYKMDYPDQFSHFTIADYTLRRDINDWQKEVVSTYDNATLYNDYVVGKIMSLLRDREAIMVFASDHGERIYDDGDDYQGHGSKPSDSPYLHLEYEIPMWFWCSDSYKASHPDIVRHLQSVKDLPFRTDTISHTILRLAGAEVNK